MMLRDERNLYWKTMSKMMDLVTSSHHSAPHQSPPVKYITSYGEHKWLEQTWKGKMNIRNRRKASNTLQN